MAGWSHNPDKADVLNKDWKSKGVAVSTTEVVAREGASNLIKRQAITLTNKGPDVVYVGPTGTAIADREVLECGQFMSIPAGPNIDITLICDTGESATVIVQEWSN